MMNGATVESHVERTTSVINLKSAIPSAFETESYRARKHAVEQEVKDQQEKVFEELQQEVSRKEIAENSRSRKRIFSRRPIRRLKAVVVPPGLAASCRRAGSPTRICPSLTTATKLGNALPPSVTPSSLGIRTGRPPRKTAAAELEVPRSMPMIAINTPLHAITSREQCI